MENLFKKVFNSRISSRRIIYCENLSRKYSGTLLSISDKRFNSFLSKISRIIRRTKKIIFCGRTVLFKYIDIILTVRIHIKMVNKFSNQTL